MKSKLQPYLISLALLLVMFGLNVAIGAVNISPGTLLRMIAAELPGVSIQSDWPESFTVILWRIRLPHAVLVALTGAALACSGATYQGLFRNPLADPYLIGVASGAGLGAVLGMSLRWPIISTGGLRDWLGMFAIPAAAFVGAMVTVVIVYSLARSGSTTSTSTLILAGVAVSAFASAVTSLLMLRSNEELRRATSWLLGGSIMTGWQPVIAILPYLVVGIGVMLVSGYTLNVMQFGDEQAGQLGVPVEKRRILLIGMASMATGAAVSFSGVIGFIGLIVPHIIRFIWGADYRRIISLSLLGGGIALLLADLFARTLAAPEVLPLGIMTAMAGGPFFLWIMRRVRSV